MIAPIGILDSGVGGLSVTSEIFRLLPHEELLYFGDTANLPYGEKTPQQIRELVFNIIDFFIKHKTKAVVMACNSSTALVLEEALNRYELPIIGVIEPGITEALRITNTKEVGLFANAVTIASGAHKKMMETISAGTVKLLGIACPKLVPLVESGILHGEEAENVIKEYFEPIRKSSADTLILGCTHYPFLEESIRKVGGETLKLVNPAYQTALRLRETLQREKLLNTNKTIPEHKFFVSGESTPFKLLGSQLLGYNISKVYTQKTM